MIPYEGVLRDVVETVVLILERTANERRIPDNNITMFFPEFETAILNSVKNGFLDRAELEKNLKRLYIKKFKNKEFYYFMELNSMLQTEYGKDYLISIWMKKP